MTGDGGVPDGGVELARITVVKSVTDTDCLVFVDATCPDGEDIALVEALGMLELAKDTLIRQAMGDDAPDAGEWG